MARFTKLVAELSEVFRRSGAHSLCYFHADHYEPWRSMAGRIDVSEPNAADIVDFLDQTSKLEFARRLTLFLKPAFRLAPSGEGVRSTEGDGVGFKPLTPQEEKIHDQALAEISKSSHELQVHLHHEYYTKNEMYSTQAKYNRDERLRQYLTEETTKELDEARFKLLIDMTLESYRRGTGLPFDRWFFVHGMWALNGSDRDVCTIDREIELLLEKGCLGDFTFPAGRMHTDPAHKAPFFCDSIDAPKCYDLAEAKPTFAYGSKADGRFFIWSSLIKHHFSSIDYYSKEIRNGLEDLERCTRELIETSVFLDGVLYIKTHAHSMNTDYFDNIRRPIYPHFHPGVQALLGVVFDAASDAGLNVQFASAGEVYDRFTSAHYTGPTDISSDEHTIRNRPADETLVNGMTPLERLDTFAHLVSSISRSVVGKRITKLGPTASGAYEYYQDLHERDSLVHPYELKVARDLAGRLPDGARIHEFGTGFGSMALLLAVAGYEVLAIDADPRRLATASAIRAELSRNVPWVAARLNFREAAIPQVLAELDCAGVTAVATDVTSTVTLAELPQLIETVAARYEAVAFDTERFFVRTHDAGEMQQVQDLFSRHYSQCQAITDASVGRFFFYAHAKTAAAVGKAARTRAPIAAGAAAAPPPSAANGSARKETLSLDEAIALVDQVGVEVMKARIAGEGVDGSGAGAFYSQIVAANRLVQHYDRAVARWLLDSLPRYTPILEIGAGIGTLSLVLAAAGSTVVALDLDHRRIETGRAIRARLVEALGRDLANFDFVEAKFPVEPPPVPRAASVAVITNMVFGWSDEQQKAMLEELSRFECAIVDADRFGVGRSTDAERDAFDALAREAGLDVEPLGLVSNMRFVRLTRKAGAPARRPAAAAKRAPVAP